MFTIIVVGSLNVDITAYAERFARDDETVKDFYKTEIK